MRTVPERVYCAAPRGRLPDPRVLRAGASLGAALIYLENQFLWSPEIETMLRDKLAGRRRDDFRLLLAAGEAEHRRRRHARDARRTDRGRRRRRSSARVHVHARHGSLSDPVYVHAKVGIVDDAWLTIGSANLNEHSLFNDTEMNVVCQERRSLARRGFASGPSTSS